MTTKVQPNVTVIKSRRLKELLENKPDDDSDDDSLDDDLVDHRYGPFREREVSFVPSSTSSSSSTTSSSSSLLSSSEKPKKQALITMEDAAERVFSFLTAYRPREEEENDEHGDADHAHQEEDEENDDDDDSDDETNHNDSDDDSDDDESFVYSHRNGTNIVWFSEDTLLSNHILSHWLSERRHSKKINNSSMRLLFYCTVVIGKRRNMHRLYFYQLVLSPVEEEKEAIPTTTLVASPAVTCPSSSSVNNNNYKTSEQQQVLVADDCLRLLSRHERVLKIILRNPKNEESSSEVSRSTAEPVFFPASLAALEEFVSQAVSPRTLVIAARPLYDDQWRAILRNCNQHVKIRLSHLDRGGGDGDGEDAGAAVSSLIEAMNLNECPTKLDLIGLLAIPDEQLFLAFVKALGENSKSLVELSIRDHLSHDDDASDANDDAASDAKANDSKTNNRLDLIFRAVSRHCGLKKLEIMDSEIKLSDDEWNTFVTKIVASHPTLTFIQLNDPQSPRSAWRDQVLVSSLRSNMVLLWLGVFMHERERLDREIVPLLRLNRFRPVAQAVKQEPNLLQRGHFFTTTLFRLCKHCKDFPDKCLMPWLYSLLRENPDLLARYSNPQDVLRKLWHKTMSRLISWEQRMLTVGMDIPKRRTMMPERTKNLQEDDDETHEMKKLKDSSSFA